MEGDFGPNAARQMNRIEGLLKELVEISLEQSAMSARIIELLEEMTYLNPYYEEEELPFMDRTVLDNYEDN